MWSEVKVTQSCLTLCNPMDYNLPGSSIHGILQARILKEVAIPFSRGSFQHRDWTRGSCMAGEFFTVWATREAQEYGSGQPIPSPGDLPDPGTEPGSPALQVDFLPTELLYTSKQLKIKSSICDTKMYTQNLWIKGKVMCYILKINK